MIKRIIKDRFLGRRRFQPFWEKLHAWALQGMNICAGDGSIDPGEIWVLQHVSKQTPKNATSVVLDVGANTGFYSAAVVRNFQANLRLYSFEPAHESYELLKKRMSANKNVECFNFGFSDNDISSTLYSWAGVSGLASVYDRFHLNLSEPNGSRLHKSQETIRLKTLDGFCDERNIDRIALLKLDVEGHELKVLQGAHRLIQSNAIDFIQFEFGGTNVDSKTFLHDFTDLLCPQYRLYRILKDGLISIEPYRERNEIFLYSNYLAIAKNLDRTF